jgi:hypothetical protein
MIEATLCCGFGVSNLRNRETFVKRKENYFKRTLSALFALCGLIFIFSGASCDPCVQLSNLVCDCEPTANVQIACRQERELQRSQRNEDDADPEICAAALQTCTCAAMENNDWEACGMTRDFVADPEEIPLESE